MGVLVVPWTSATRFCDGAPSAIDENHLGIVKPDRLNHDSVVILINALNQYVIGQELVGILNTPDFTPEDGEFLFRMSDPIGKNSARLVNAGGGKLSYTLAQVSDPNLFIWPEDTPREIPAKKTERISIALGFGAVKNEYRFVLKSDVAPDRVRVEARSPKADVR